MDTTKSGTDEGVLEECPSCLDVFCTKCEECTIFQEVENVPCCYAKSTKSKSKSRSRRSSSVDEDKYKKSSTCGFDPCNRRGFRFLEDNSGTKFNATPEDTAITEQFLQVPESDPTAYFTQAQDVISHDDLAKGVSYIEKKFQTAADEITDKHRENFMVNNVKAETIISMFGKTTVQKLLDIMRSHTGHEDQPITRIFFQRFEHYGDKVSPYHTDGDAISLVILLNDDYEGGEMTFLTQHGAAVVDSVAGTVTVHGEGALHGNAAINGTKYQLTLLSYPNVEDDCLFKGMLPIDTP